MLGATGYQTLNIVETPVETKIDQCDDQDQYNVHYGTNNSPSHNMANRSKQKLANQPKQKHQTLNPKEITILKRDQSGTDSKNQNLNLPCKL